VVRFRGVRHGDPFTFTRKMWNLEKIRRLGGTGLQNIAKQLPQNPTYIHVYIEIYICINTYINSCTCKYTNSYTYIYICIYEQIYTYIYIYMNKYTHIYPYWMDWPIPHTPLSNDHVHINIWTNIHIYTYIPLLNGLIVPSYTPLKCSLVVCPITNRYKW
jgi:hypothetical protein